MAKKKKDHVSVQTTSLAQPTTLRPPTAAELAKLFSDQQLLQLLQELDSHPAVARARVAPKGR